MLLSWFLCEFASLTLIQVVLKKIVMLVHRVDGGNLFALIRCMALENCGGFMFVSPSLVYVV